MGISSDLIEKYKNSDRLSIYKFSLKRLEEYIDRPDSEFFKKNRTNYRFLTREKKVLTFFFIFRILMLAPEEYIWHEFSEITGESEKKTYAIKTVEDAIAYFQREDEKFIEHLDESLKQWLNAINEDSNSYSMLSDHPIVITNDNESHQHMSSKVSLERVQVFLNNQEKIKLILKDPELEDSEISKLRINQELSQLLLQYKRLSGSELETISVGLQEYINYYQATDYSGGNEVSRKEENQGKHYSWLMLQLFPVALFISINLAKNERPDPKIFDIIEDKHTPHDSSSDFLSKKLARFEKIGSILDDLVRYCFCKQDMVGVSAADKPDYFRDSQYKFLLKELKNPTSAVLCERKPRRITPYTVEDPSKMFSLGRKSKPKNNPEHWMELYDRYILKKPKAYDVFKKILDLSEICYETRGKRLLFAPDRALNWMVFEQLTGLLTAADYAFFPSEYLNYPGNLLRNFRGSHTAYALRDAETILPLFSSSEFLRCPLKKYDTLVTILSDFIRKTSQSYSTAPLSRKPEDSSHDYIDWITNKLNRQKKRKRPMTEEVKKIMDLQQANAKPSHSISTAITESKDVQ